MLLHASVATGGHFCVRDRVELMEVDIMSCWNQGTMQIPLQKKHGPFTDVITFLDEFLKSEPT